MTEFERVAELIQDQAGYSGHNEVALNNGMLDFATIKQIRYIASLFRVLGVPEEWRLYITGALVGRQLRSSKDLSMVEASALLEWLLHGSEGQEDNDGGPCTEAQDIIEAALTDILAAGHAQVAKRENGGKRVVVVTQPGLC